MLDADFRRQWVQDRINDLRGKDRLSYAEIARRMGILHRQQVQAVAKGGPVGKDFIDRMCKAFNFTPPIMPGAKPVMDVVNSPTMSPMAMVQEAAAPYGEQPSEMAQLRNAINALVASNVMLASRVEEALRKLAVQANG